MYSELSFSKKRLTRLVALLIVALCTLPAQAGIKFGVTAGAHLVGFSSFSKDMVGSLRNKSWYVGPKVNIGLLGIGADAALLYDQRHYDGKDSKSPIMRTIEIPVNFRYTLGLSKIVGVFFTTGPQIGFSLGNTKWEQTLQNGAQHTFQQIFTRENKTLSWNVGAGAKVIDHFEVGLSYNFMLTRYAKVKQMDAHDNVVKSFRNGTLNLQVAYIF